MRKTQDLVRFNVRIPAQDYLKLEYQAEKAGLNVGVYARQIMLERIRGEGPEGRGELKINPDFAENLATALAITIITGAVTTKGLERAVEETTLEIMQSLGAA